MTSKLSGSTDTANGDGSVTGWRGFDDRDDVGEVPVDRLYSELISLKGGEADGGSSEELEEFVSSILSTLFPETSFEFDRGLIAHDLDEVLILLIALRESETNGQQLMEDLSTLFDADISPGTVYPRLHELENGDVLDVHDLVRTKEYRVGETERARALVEDAMHQHLALASIFSAALDQF